MAFSLTRRVSLALPILFYLLALVALRLHLPTGDGPLLVLATLALLAAFGIGAGLVMHHRLSLGRVSSGQ